ncbi:WXG100 family type VII secretion target [Microbacterium testaceum]|uniref:WXG100 family type VII secretion target n=1 Tax=Microbacterium testaceum TaxID=2033 RepID=UPI0024351DA2|nr:WXG100 family type VII secretion target [Microbacterium testaceum]
MHVTADTDSLAASAQALSSAADALSAEMDTLASASQTMRAGWKGEAQAAWTGRHAQMDSAMRDKAAVLRLTSQRVSQYAQDLAQADVDGARAVLGF